MRYLYKVECSEGEFLIFANTRREFEEHFQELLKRVDYKTFAALDRDSHRFVADIRPGLIVRWVQIS